MKRPKDEVVKFVIKAVLRDRKVDSQAMLAVLINTELKKVDPEYSITGKRLRLIVSSMPEVKIKTDVRKGSSVPARCPSCNSPLKKVWAKNLKGRRILENLKCPKCGYKGHDGRWLPRRYCFFS